MAIWGKNKQPKRVSQLLGRQPAKWGEESPSSALILDFQHLICLMNKYALPEGCVLQCIVFLIYSDVLAIGDGLHVGMTQK